MTIIYYILILGITVCIHEFGHFLFAKKSGIYVYEFSIGMGPRLFKWNRKNDETEYSIRLFPIGGYVAMAGEDLGMDADRKIPKEKRMQNKKWHQRFMTVIAGVLFNFILAIILLFIIALINGAPVSTPYVSMVEKDSKAAIAGLEPKDKIVEIGNKKIHSTDMLMLELQIQKGKTTKFVVEKENGVKKELHITPAPVEGGYQYGFSLENKMETGFLASMKYAIQKTINILEQMVFIIVYLCTGALSLNTLAGPIGIFSVVDEAASAGLLNIIYLLAFISLNVGFINLLPIPAFDGGRLLFLVIEKIKGSPVKPETENKIHQIGFMFLLLLIIVISYNDIIRILK